MENSFLNCIMHSGPFRSLSASSVSSSSRDLNRRVRWISAAARLTCDSFAAKGCSSHTVQKFTLIGTGVLNIKYLRSQKGSSQLGKSVCCDHWINRFCSFSPSPAGCRNSATIFLVLSNSDAVSSGRTHSRNWSQVSSRPGTGSLGSRCWWRKVLPEDGSFMWQHQWERLHIQKRMRQEQFV